jgi:serine/threonine-protein kinase
VNTPVSSGGRLTPPSQRGLPELSKYELLEEIGHGGMATVYRARDPRLGRDVAVKVIHKHLRENEEVATRFVAEARAAAKLRHRGIVEVFDVSAEDDPERYLVVELLRGTTLRKVLERNRDMPAEVGAAITLELCAALEHAHAEGIVHRDVKPENVLVELPADRVSSGASAPISAPGADKPLETDDVSITPTPAPNDTPEPVSDGGNVADTQRSKREDVAPGLPAPKRKQRSERAERRPRSGGTDVVIKLTDFGIAKMLDAQGVTSTGQVLGSPAHMAPEQIEGGEIDTRTDVFALGVLMYECLVGHLPFEGKNPAQVLRKVLEGTYAAPDRERPTVGGRWSKILAHALARDPEQRTPSAAALGEQIKDELLALGISDPHAEVRAYFAAPDTYADELKKRVVPRLVERGEAARKANNIPGAADDFNRAAALAPNDPSILRRLTSLNTSRSRRVLVRRLASILAASAVLGLAAFGIARFVRTPKTALPTTPTALAETSPVVSATASAPLLAPSIAHVIASAVESSSRPPRLSPPPLSTTGGTATPPPPAKAERSVRFAINPPGAKLVVDGKEVAFGAVTKLVPGPHPASLSVESSTCCKRFEGAIGVTPPPEDKADEVQMIPLSVEFLPATVTLRGPSGGTATCRKLNLVLAVGETKKVKVTQIDQSDTCEFTPPKEGPKVKGPAQVKAGEATMISWPGG